MGTEYTQTVGETVVLHPAGIGKQDVCIRHVDNRLDAALKQQVGPCLGRGGVAAENGNANGIFPDTGLKRCRIPHGDTAGTSGCGALNIQLGQEFEVIFRTAVVNQHVDHQRIIAQKKNTMTPVQPEGRF